jgi:hypothetical protein
MESSKWLRDRSKSLFDCWCAPKRDGRPKCSGIPTTSSCLKSHKRRPITCEQSLRAHVPRELFICFPENIAFKVSERIGVIFKCDRRASQACAEVALHNDSLQGNFRGSSLRSIAPRRLVRVQRLQSYSNAAQAALRSCSWLIQDNQ